MKKKALLVMACTADYLFSAANVLIGLEKHCPKMFDDVIIFTDAHALQSDKKAIEKIRPVTFETFTYQLSNLADRARLSSYTNMTYARFEMPAYLDRYSKVFWLDTDILITADLSELLGYARTGLSMSVDLDPAPATHSIQAFFNKPLVEYDMTAAPYATGVIILSDKLKNPLSLRNYLYEKMDRYSSDVTYADQGILHLMIQDFNLEVDVFDKLTFHAFAFEDKSKAKLIHLLANNKPWRTYTARAYDEWYENHIIWRQLGGSEVPGLAVLAKKFPAAFYGPQRYQNVLQLEHIQQSAGQGTHFLPANIPSGGLWEYYRCKILSKITLGKKRAHYKRKSEALHERVRRIREFMRN